MPPSFGRIALIGVLLGWCAALIGLRILRTGTVSFAFLVWNLFLAFIPMLMASLLLEAHRRRLPAVFQAGCFALWLLFLPNAPYILTDLVHLAPRPPVPLWYDLALLLSCAGTGLLLGYASVAVVQAVVAEQFGRVAGWLVAIGSLALSGFGIYLGRFMRFNSWEVVTDPRQLLADVAGRLLHPRAHLSTFAVTLIFGGALTLGYLALRVLATTFEHLSRVTATPE
jgi:uncharacterized membrane protein